MSRRVMFMFSGALLLLVVATGCQATDRRGAAGDPPPRPNLVADHNARVAALTTLTSGGNIELHWEDDDGSHFEQGDIKLMLRLPDLVALRIFKFDTLMWLGTNGERYWYFDLLDDDESIAYVGAFERGGGGNVPGPIHPMRLLDLIALSPLPADAVPSFDAEREAWVVEGSGRGGPWRVAFDPSTGLPVEVESLGERGEVLYRSELTRYEPVEADALLPTGRPRLATRVEVHDPATEGRAVLFLDAPTTRIDVSRLERQTDFDELVESLQPKRIEHVDDGASR